MKDAFTSLPTPIVPATLDDAIRYRVPNPDGSISTIRTMSFNDGKGEVLIPTVIDNRIVSNDEAIDYYKKSGESFGTFKTIEEANQMAEYLHTLHAQRLANERNNAVPRP